MKKLLVFLFTILLLSACTSNDDLVAYVDDFKNSGFQNNAGQSMALTEEGLMMSGPRNESGSKKLSDIDLFLESLGIQEGEHFLQIYENAKITTDGSKYIVSIPNIVQFEFEKIGERIIKDSQGIEYFTAEYSKE
ncbi:membrane lipoprotein lipid attachment site-containing protein [Metasolibacillus meyeri]|uniref:Membrane lipoprotein lipid attachment site-containing protein n=1 Tax=Metasolibacillus meyeri TaxID=1071052 RepID=A0AAW9NK92_9BACL|nr:membrane lipoprotein lipid attachment site-containing protein [Metasolibacillus meyeri]MEC1177577.1 membrane lipoprotein lipid attachment site-containing protein [Metasolibacillus meyeri]